MLVLATLSIALMLLDRRTTLLASARSVLSVPLSSIQYLVSSPIYFFDEVLRDVTNRAVLIQENKSMAAKELLLEAQVQRLQAVESENSQLRALLHASVRVQGKVLVAQLLAVDSDPFMRRPWLDRGQNDGLFIGQPVLDAYGVMGQVIRVTPFMSQILLITDPHSGVPIEVVRSGVRAIVVGDAFTGKLRLVNVPQTADIKVDDLLVTSGMGKNYPHGYPVGKIDSVVKDPRQQFAMIQASPLARSDRSRQVLLVWPDQPQKLPR